MVDNLSDLVATLRQGSMSSDDYRHEAADAITSLRAEVRSMTKMIENGEKGFSLLAEENRILRAGLDKIAAWHDGEPGPHMDEPVSSLIARITLEKSKNVR